MTTFHSATFRLLATQARFSRAAVSEVEHAERRLGFPLPASVREWYCNGSAFDILARYSNQDWPIPLRDFTVVEWKTRRFLPFKHENQYVCVWAMLLDGADDPAVYVDVDSNGAQWDLQAPTFSAHVYACVWDYTYVLDQPALVQAQNAPLSSAALEQLRGRFSEQPRTFAWPGDAQHRFLGDDQGILIWAGADQADWFVGARSAESLESALRVVWDLDDVARSFYGCSALGQVVLDTMRGAT